MQQQSSNQSSITLSEREKAQSYAAKLAVIHQDLFLEWGTGLGKSYAALQIIQQSNEPWYILCSERVHIENWEQEIEKHKVSVDVTILTYASMHKIPKDSHPNIVFDEVHRFLTSARIDKFFQIGTKGKHLMLSATLPTPLLPQFKFVFPNHYRYTYSLKKAVENEILPEPKIYVLMCELDNTRRNQVHIIKWGTMTKTKTFRSVITPDELKRFSKKNYPSVELTVMCTEREKYNFLINAAQYAKASLNGSNASWKVNRVNIAYGNVKKYITDCKEKYLRHTIDKLQISKPDYRGIVFTNSSEVLENLTSTNGIYSKQSAKVNDTILQKFQNKEINIIYTVKMLTEGQNLNGIDYVILNQLDNKQLTTIQRIGRGLRAKEPIIYILCMKDTRDVEYLEKADKAIKMAFKYFDMPRL